MNIKEYIKISIVTVCLNCADTIEKTIKSVIDQEYPNLEYIVIDGGSTDGTLDIIKKYADNINFIISEKDSGIYDAMNKGISVASGVLIAFINDGDRYEKDALLTVSKIYQKCRADVLYGNVIVLKDGQSRLVEYDNNTPELLVWGMSICHQAVFAKTNLMKKYGFDISYKISADYKWIADMYFSGKSFQHISKFLCTYSENGVSSLYKDLNMEESRRVHKYLCKKYNSFSSDHKRALDNIYIQYRAGDLFSKWYENHKFEELFNDWFKENIKKPLIVFGCGKNGKRVKRILDSIGIENVMLIDNNGTGDEIKSPDSITEINEYDYIVTPNDNEEICAQLLEMGVNMENVYVLKRLITDICKKSIKTDEWLVEMD